MPIKPHEPTQVKAAVPPDEIETTVANVLGSLGVANARTFQHAAEMYNSDFFKDESHEFKVALCRALVTHFKGYQNSFWSKVLQ